MCLIGLVSDPWDITTPFVPGAIQLFPNPLNPAEFNLHLFGTVFVYAVFQGLNV
jgi:hypothetical protein